MCNNKGWKNFELNFNFFSLLYGFLDLLTKAEIEKKLRHLIKELVVVGGLEKKWWLFDTEMR